MSKIAASLLKQIDSDYDVQEDTDERIKLGLEEYGVPAAISRAEEVALVRAALRSTKGE